MNYKLHTDYIQSKNKFSDLINSVSKIPSNRIISKKDLKIINNYKDIYNILNALYIQIPKKTGFGFGHHLTKKSFGNNILNNFPNNSIIFCPGDSTFKIITLIDLFFKKKNTTYIINGCERKYFFITFTFSYYSMKRDLEYKNISNYKLKKKITNFFNKYKSIISKNKIKNILIFDKVSSGSTKDFLLDLFRSQLHKKTEFIEIRSILYDDQHEYFIEHKRNLNFRCTPACNSSNIFDSKSIFINTTACNSYIICLYYSIKYPSKIRKYIKKIMGDEIYDGDYYYNKSFIKYMKYDNFIMSDMKFYDITENSIISWKDYRIKSNYREEYFILSNKLKPNYIMDINKHLYFITVNSAKTYYRIKTIDVDDIKPFLNHDGWFETGFSSEMVGNYEFFNPLSIASIQYYKIKVSEENYKQINKVIKIHQKNKKE